MQIDNILDRDLNGLCIIIVARAFLHELRGYLFCQKRKHVANKKR